MLGKVGDRSVHLSHGRWWKLCVGQVSPSDVGKMGNSSFRNLEGQPCSRRFCLPDSSVSGPSSSVQPAPASPWVSILIPSLPTLASAHTTPSPAHGDHKPTCSDLGSSAPGFISVLSRMVSVFTKVHFTVTFQKPRRSPLHKLKMCFCVTSTSTVQGYYRR